MIRVIDYMRNHILDFSLLFSMFVPLDIGVVTPEMQVNYIYIFLENFVQWSREAVSL